ncbi:MAG: magnesium/cobalt transporter CorA [Candidatus Rifleibacteriota bacterium]
MLQFVKKGIAESKRGKPPGTITKYSDKEQKEVEFELIKYDTGFFEQKQLKGAANLPLPDDSEQVNWICVYGHSDIGLLNRLAELYGISHLALEDILNPDHRPKLEFFDNHLLVILKMISYDSKGVLISEQISIVLGKNFVLAIQEQPGDLFDPIRERLRTSAGRIRTMSADYLAYSLLDVIVDNYFVILEDLAEELEELEMILIKEPEEFEPIDIHDLKMQLFYLRKISWPLREIAHSLQKTESGLVRSPTRLYFSDVYDHAIRVLETTETLREVSVGISELYTSNISLKMNEIMQTLTIISTIFIPLTFIAGVYGMNFEVMPELKWPNAYFGVLGIMVVIAVIMLIFFRRRRWL